jgi:hypothetical protein
MVQTTSDTEGYPTLGERKHNAMRSSRRRTERVNDEHEEMPLLPLGHELQHAIEVLSESAVTNGVTMYNFLRRTAPTDSNRFETTAAVNAGNAVIDELMNQRAAR